MPGTLSKKQGHALELKTEAQQIFDKLLRHRDLPDIRLIAYALYDLCYFSPKAKKFTQGQAASAASLAQNKEFDK